MPRLGAGIDRTLIRPLLDLTPQERLALAEADANSLGDFLERVRRD